MTLDQIPGKRRSAEENGSWAGSPFRRCVESFVRDRCPISAQVPRRDLEQSPDDHEQIAVRFDGDAAPEIGGSSLRRQSTVGRGKIVVTP